MFGKLHFHAPLGFIVYLLNQNAYENLFPDSLWSIFNLFLLMRCEKGDVIQRLLWLCFVQISRGRGNINYRVFIEIVFFSARILERLSPLPRQHSAAIGWTKKLPANRSDCTLALRWELSRSLTQRCRRGRGCSELWKKHNFSWTPCICLVEAFSTLLLQYD